MTAATPAASQGWNFQHSYFELPNIFHSSVQPTPVRQPEMVIFNSALAEQLGLRPAALAGKEGAQIFAGNVLPHGAQPLAQAYAGHQFANFTMLGDGRALLLGEHLTPRGEVFDIQLKGAGRTAYSRRGDGRAALGPMLREYIISEAMHGLGIPTTRSLAVVRTGESVMRESPLPGAVLTRVAASHLRVGTFEFAAAHGQESELAALILYTLERHDKNFSESEPPALQLLRNVIARQAKLIAQWMHVGFIHGVMNTDNMALSGETIDYGPCAFMDTYHPNTVFSSIDTEGRYSFANQARIALWNLERFAETLLPLLDEDHEKAVEVAQDALESYAEIFNQHWLNGMACKLGIFERGEEDQALITDFLQLLHKTESDYTNSFRRLNLFIDEHAPAQSSATEERNALFMRLKTAVFTSADFAHWQQRWQTRWAAQTHKSSDEVRALMNAHNPNIIPRNHRVQQALSAAEAGNYEPLNTLVRLLATPFEDSPEHEPYRMPPQPEERVLRTFCGT